MELEDGLLSAGNVRRRREILKRSEIFEILSVPFDLSLLQAEIQTHVEQPQDQMSALMPQPRLKSR